MSKKPGRVIRISDEVFEALTQRRGKKSWDAYLRRHLGLPVRQLRKGEKAPEPPAEAWVLLSQAYSSQAKAKGAAIMEMARTGQEPERPVRMRELI